MTTVLDSPPALRGHAVIALHDSLWRVTRPGGEVLGYVELLPGGDTPRFRAKRLLVPQCRFVSIGEFWTADEALECLRVG